MPRFNMQFKAQMEGIERLVMPTDMRINLSCEHPSSGEKYPNLWVTQEEELEIPHSRGTAHVVVKIGDKRHGTIKIEHFLKDFEYTAEQSDTFVTVCQLECRDLEPKEWHIAGDEFAAFGAEGKTAFKEIVFEDGAWFDYDENKGCEVSIQDISFRFTRA